MHHRRAVLIGGLATMCVTAAPVQSIASEETPLEKMPLLEGKDYGKSRMRCVGACTWYMHYGGRSSIMCCSGAYTHAYTIPCTTSLLHHHHHHHHNNNNRYPDYTLTPSGLQYIDLREGTGKQPNQGATVLIDWGGYTIGYYGRPFEARNKVRVWAMCGERNVVCIEAQNKVSDGVYITLKMPVLVFIDLIVHNILVS